VHDCRPRVFVRRHTGGRPGGWDELRRPNDRGLQQSEPNTPLNTTQAIVHSPTAYKTQSEIDKPLSIARMETQIMSKKKVYLHYKTRSQAVSKIAYLIHADFLVISDCF